MLDQVASDLFTEIIPGEIVSKSFMDTFVIMGGTGCLIGLLAAMLIFGKRSSTRKLLRMAWVPCFFNISELLVFGFPVVYNPYMMIPFLLSPALCYTNAFLLSKAGFMPLVTKTVVWTTPPLLSGYIATGSLRGLAVQLMNILISTACYAPFIMLYENKTLNEYPSEMEELFALFKRGRDSNEELKLTETDGNAGRLARLLATDLEDALIASSGEISAKKVENPISVEYEEQYDEDGKCVGARALLKWEHIQRAPEGGYCIRIRTQKTKTEATLPISMEAYELCGAPSTGTVFKGFKRSMAQHPLKEWLKSAGITKPMSFHCFRHSYAVLQVYLDHLKQA